MPRTIACLAVSGRRPLLKLTIQRLIHVNKVEHVICSGDDEEDRQTAVNAGAEWVNCANYPLSKKWNRSFHAASFYDPDYYLFVGSSDWLSENWLPVMYDHMKDGTGMAGKRDMYLLDNGANGYKRLCHWPGYIGERESETIGIGRILSAEAMEKLNFSPFDAGIHNGMDGSMQRRLNVVKSPIKTITDESLKSLSISDYRWPNKHKFEDHWNNILPSTIIENANEWLQENFNEAMML
jgi:hypothetical protein